MHIGEAAKVLRLNPRTLRYYEKMGLLPQPERSADGFRAYTGWDIERVEFIRKAQQLDLRLSEIREIRLIPGPGSRPLCLRA